MQSVHIRWMISRDMPEVLEIERQSFASAWSGRDFRKCLRQRNYIGMVAECRDRVIGYMVYEIHRRQIELLNFAVHPAFRRLGVGRQMIDKLVSKLANKLHRGRCRIRLMVRESNLPAQLFFRSNRFLATSVLRGFYDETSEDAYQMELRLEPADTVQVCQEL